MSEDNVLRLYDDKLLEDLRMYATYAFVELKGKAKRIHDMCIERGHKEWAYKIANKHGQEIPYQSDANITTAYFLLANKYKNFNHE